MNGNSIAVVKQDVKWVVFDDGLTGGRPTCSDNDRNDFRKDVIVRQVQEAYNSGSYEVLEMAKTAAISYDPAFAGWVKMYRLDTTKNLPYSDTYQADAKLLRKLDAGDKVVFHAGDYDYRVATVTDASARYLIVNGIQFRRSGSSHGKRAAITGLTTHSIRKVNGDV